MTKANYLLNHVKANAETWFDQNVDYPSPYHRITYNQKSYVAKSYNDLVTMIMKDGDEL